MHITINNKLGTDKEVIKSFLEKIFFVNPFIINCKISKKIILVRFDKKIKNITKIKKDIESLILRINLTNKLSKNEIFFQNNVSLKKKNNNVYNNLIKSKQIIKVSEGVFVYQGDFLKKLKKVDKFFFSYGKKLKFNEISTNGTLPLTSLIDNGYLNNFPNHLIFVSNVKRDLQVLDKISEKKNLNSSFFLDKLESPKLILSPTVCYHCFELNRKQNLKKNITYNVVSKCNRYESKNYKTLERLQTFTMREYVAYGSEKYVDNFLEKNMKNFIKIFKRLNIKFRIVSASDPFFSQEGIKKLLFQKSKILKYEVQFFLPKENKWLAVGSFNNHLTSLTNKYSIKRNSNLLFSGCIGFGFERFIYALISQNIKF